MSSDQLKRAASVLRQIGEQSTPGPWHTEQTNLSDWIVDAIGVSVADCGFDEDVLPEVHADATWIAMVSPAIAEPLAIWLDETARQYDGPKCNDPTGCCNNCQHRYDYVAAIYLAQVILGEPS